MSSQDLKEVICVLPILALVAVKLFVFPALFCCMLAFFFFASTWTDTAAVPYLQFFLFAGPLVWFAGTVYLIFRFTHPINRSKSTSSYV
jgi:hypothetical protein